MESPLPVASRWDFPPYGDWCNQINSRNWTDCADKRACADIFAGLPGDWPRVSLASGSYMRGSIFLVIYSCCLLSSGCALLPDVVHEPQFHNPFPQLNRVAVLPFYNLSAEPTVDGELIAKLYYTELQQIPGFEVVPVGVVRQFLMASRQEPRTPEDFQKLAQDLGVDAVVAGAITEYTPYYPPRLGLVVRWYAANPGFHEIPPGYGLPWGTPAEEDIPEALVFEAEFALAKEQLKSQTPEAVNVPAESVPGEEGAAEAEETSDERLANSELPVTWPDPRGFVPPAPSARRPPLIPHSGPVLSHTRLYDGHDSDFTEALASYYYFRDDARFGGWQGYLQRSEDFARFCCYMHITEMLSARGGAGKTRVVWRWPIGRYER